MTFLGELKRRNVIRVGVAWLALSWLLVAMCLMLFPALGLPVAALRWIILALVLAWIPAMLLAWRYELTPQGVRVDRGPGRDNPQNAITATRLDQMTVVVILAALSLTLLRQFIADNAPTAPAVPVAAIAVPDAATARPAPRPADPRSIAVLPFANMSPDPDDAYFSDGLSEELLNVLARIDGLKVTSRSSSFVFRDARIGAQEIAGQLGVAYLLEGSVRRQGEEVRITAQLIDARSDLQLWSSTYDRKLVDIFRLQEEISQAIADALADSLGVRRVEVADATSDLEAYGLFLRGRQLFAQRGANLPAARELLEQAVARDPQFADAWAALAGTWYVWRSYAEEPDGVDTLQQAAQAADTALSIQPEHPGALAVRARILANRGDHLQQAEVINQALAREPNNANTWLWQGLGLFEVGHRRAAHASFVQAQRLDPLSGLQQGWLGISNALLGDREAGIELLQRSHALGWRGPASRALFFIAHADNDGSDPTQAYLDWLHDDDGTPMSQRALGRSIAPALTDPERRADAQRALLEAAAASPEQDWATLLQLFGLTDAAVDMAFRSDPSRTQTLLLSMWYPQFRAFRQHAQFAAFAERNGLTDYWREHGPPDGCSMQLEPALKLDCEQ